MLNIRIIQISKFIFIGFILFASSLLLVLQTYDYRSSFSSLENLKLEKQELSFQSNILLEEVKFSNNQISLRKFASENLGMVLPDHERVYLERRVD